jgi:HSP20 family protein
MKLVTYQKPKALSLFDRYDDFDSFFSLPTLFPVSFKSSPAVDVLENEKGYVVKADIPGYTKDEIDITLDNNVLTIRGEKKQEETEEKSNYIRKERTYSSFEKSVLIEGDVTIDGAKAAINNGVLKLDLPKKEVKRIEAKKINID